MDSPRLKIPPFEKARTVLEALQHRKQSPDLTLSKKVKLKRENPDLLELCHAVPMEVIHMGGKGYSLEPSDDAAAFEEWLQCYCVPGMRSLRDGNGRTIWFQGEPGPMAPKGEKSRKRRSRVNADPEPPSPKVQSLCLDISCISVFMGAPLLPESFSCCPIVHFIGSLYGRS
ncbi:endonuclease 8-like 1 isoform X2 [Chrysemys picta bellii]|uniref:endonuclease 8-like 1 isoform X2 n=1 Tax=Chrysemys picta bellii TaxID=8478 RepID=UPI0032B12BFF